MAAMYVERTMPLQIATKALEASAVSSHSGISSLIAWECLVRVRSASNTPTPRVIHNQPGVFTTTSGLGCDATVNGPQELR